MNQDIPISEIYSVSELNGEVRSLIEEKFPAIWVEGEISNLARPASGHIYFSLKDENAQIRCAMFRMSNRLLKFRPQDGMQVLLRANASLYEARGDFQLIVDYMEEAGAGLLRKKFELLKARLAAEGLFDEIRKKALPFLPDKVGVITSPTGAALQDILTVLKRRFPALPVMVYPIPVQGVEAPAKIVKMIKKANERAECDILILARGGGSLEDLWAFNDEQVARAIYESHLPVVSAIGHETDFTIADFVADKRAATPSAAAEMVSPNKDDLLAGVAVLQKRLVYTVNQKILGGTNRLNWIVKRIQHPSQKLRQYVQRVDDLEMRLGQAQKIHWQLLQSHVAQLKARLQQHNPAQRIRELRLRTSVIENRIQQVIRNSLERRLQKLTALGKELDAVSPLATLRRGYAIVSTEDHDTVIRRSKQLSTGQKIKGRLHEGSFIATIIETE